MQDSDMLNILQNFSNASEGTGKVVDSKGRTKVSEAAEAKNDMLNILKSFDNVDPINEGLDAQQKSVNQMPGDHKMAKAGAKHPASNYLVGGAEEQDGQDVSDEASFEDFRKSLIAQANEEAGQSPVNEIDINDMDAEYWGQDDSDKFAPGTRVHVGHMVPRGSGIEGDVVEVRDEWIIIEKDGKKYKGQLKNATVVEDVAVEDTIAKRKPQEEVHKKKSLADVLRSMEESEDELAARFQRELHGEAPKKELHKGDNGKFDLAEEEALHDKMFAEILQHIQDGEAIVVTAKRGYGPRTHGVPVDYNIAVVDADTFESVNEADIISGDPDSEIDQLVEKLGDALFWEARSLAKEVYAEEGPGKSGAKTEDEYVEYAVKRFLTKEYLRAIMGNIIESYNFSVKTMSHSRKD